MVGQSGLPDDLSAAIQTALASAGDPGPIRRAQRVAGGDINQAARVETGRGQYFVKWRHNPPPGFFEAEAVGLRLLEAAGAVRVPKIVAQRAADRHTSFLILDWIDTRTRSRTAADALGRALARQHAQPQTQYGLDHDNFIGRLPQPNHPTSSWIDFYRTQRLGAQHDLAARRGYLPSSRARLLDSLMASLDDWIDEALCQPSLLHGDLWGGNWLVAASGEPVLIDPAVYVGDREADLAMTALFGGFPASFYDAYAEVFPLAPGWQERQPLYQLYYLLCHLNLFGETYGSSVDSILRRYSR